jgi:hypothetical protein
VYSAIALSQDWFRLRWIVFSMSDKTEFALEGYATFITRIQLGLASIAAFQAFTNAFFTSTGIAIKSVAQVAVVDG